MDETEMKRMIEEMSKMPGMPKPMHLTVRYDDALQEITRVAEEPMWMGEGGTFVYLLQNVFMAHPDIEKRYPPGSLRLMINGTFPKTYSPLFDSDIVTFDVSK